MAKRKKSAKRDHTGGTMAVSGHGTDVLRKKLRGNKSRKSRG